jgi:hypothetical protein
MHLSLLLLVSVAFSLISQAATLSFTCNFPLAASPSGVKKESKPFELRFVSDIKTKKSYLLGNNGSSEVTPIGNQHGGVTFIEVTGSGNVMATVIAASGEAVHSRNGNMFGKLIPSQYYGKCTAQ